MVWMLPLIDEFGISFSLLVGVNPSDKVMDDIVKLKRAREEMQKSVSSPVLEIKVFDPTPVLFTFDLSKYSKEEYESGFGDIYAAFDDLLMLEKTKEDISTEVFEGMKEVVIQLPVLYSSLCVGINGIKWELEVMDGGHLFYTAEIPWEELNV